MSLEVLRGSSTKKMTVVTGPSGSGKTTLAFDILFAEGQRRYVESLSTYARRFLGRQPAHPDLGLGPVQDHAGLVLLVVGKLHGPGERGQDRRLKPGKVQRTVRYCLP